MGFDLAANVMGTAGAPQTQVPEAPPSPQDQGSFPTPAGLRLPGTLPSYLQRPADPTSVISPGDAQKLADAGHISPALNQHIQGLHAAKAAAPNSNTMAMDLTQKRADITGGGLDKQAEALKAEQDAKDAATGEVTDAATQANDVYAQQLQQDQDAHQAAFDENKAWHNQHQQDIQAAMGQGVDAGKFWHDKGAAGSVLTGIGMALSGLAAAGTGGQNTAIPVVQKGIDDSIRVQEKNLDTKLHVLQMSGADQAEKERAQSQLLAEKSNLKAKAYTTALAQVNVIAAKAGIPADDARVQGLTQQLNSQRDMALTAPAELAVAQKKVKEQQAAAAAAQAFNRSEEDRKFNRGLSADLIKQDNVAKNKDAAGKGTISRSLVVPVAKADQAEAAINDLHKIMGSGLNVTAPLIPTKYKEERDATLERASHALAEVTGEKAEDIREKLNSAGETTRKAYMNDYMAQIATLRKSAKTIKEGGIPTGIPGEGQ